MMLLRTLRGRWFMLGLSMTYFLFTTMLSFTSHHHNVVTAFQLLPSTCSFNRCSRVDGGNIAILTPSSSPSSFEFSLSSETTTMKLYMSDQVIMEQQQQQQQLNTHNNNNNNIDNDSISNTALATTSYDLQTIQQTVNNKRLLNGFVLGTLLVGTIYGLTHVQLEALIALWEYDMGPIDGHLVNEMNKMSVAVEVMFRVPIDALHSYEALVPQNPIFYKACTSGVAYALGDFVSQVVQGKSLEDIDLSRSLRSGTAGFIGHGPLCHYWLSFMENYLDFNGAWWATGIKVTADLTVWSIFLCSSYTFIIGMLELRDPRDVWKDVKATTWPALRSAWRFWPFVHTISFSHAVPIDLKLLWVDVMEVVWVTILSKVANEDKIAAFEMQELEDDVHEHQDNEAAASMMSPPPPPTATPTSSSDYISLWETSQKAIQACWPLIAMWPVLYLGYQIEVLLGLEV